jgi:hypothetical protein
MVVKVAVAMLICITEEIIRITIVFLLFWVVCNEFMF